ncbi:MAG: PAS domain-containing sensor histidine kinase [Elusimicrobia bacterium]|nr:PAS domain-containing sensor histidine kinase [Elusimicrobiota bacterium]
MSENAAALLPLFDQLTDGICLSDDNGRILYLNPPAERLLGFGLDQIGEASLCDLLCARLTCPDGDDCARACALKKAGSSATAATFQGRYGAKPFFAWRDDAISRVDERKSLRVRCLKTATAWLDRAHPGKRLTIIEDATAQERLETERADWRHMLAHDLRNPLTSIQAVLASLQDDAQGGAPVTLDAENLRIGVANCRRMAELLDLYLDVAKLDAGLMPVEARELDGAEVAARCAADQEPLARSRGVSLTVRATDPARVLADESLLERILQNLLDNAIKYTPEGGRVELSLDAASPDVILFHVTDNGPGIPEEELPLLFDRYHQAQARRQGRTKGTGLGLAFCRRALSAMNGDIRVESTPGEGSRFSVLLPRAVAKEFP